MRRALPYTPFAPPREGPVLPMDAPTLQFRNHYGTPSETRRGEQTNTKGSLINVIPVQVPHDTTAGGPAIINPLQGEDGKTDPSIASNTVTGGVVKGYITDPNTIRKPLIVSRNLFSPTSHAQDAGRLALSGKIPPPAIKPSKDIGMPPKMGKRGTAGNFYHPAPIASFSVPDSTTWLRGRFK